jgi:hypothetical protein
VRTSAAIDEVGFEHLDGAITIIEPTRTRTFGGRLPQA